MDTPTPASLKLREKIRTHRSELEVSMQAHGATNLRLFGSVARGDANEESDLDFLVDFEPETGSALFRLGGLLEDFHQILSHSVDIVPTSMIKKNVALNAFKDAISV